jgi:hypothetical protein
MVTLLLLLVVVVLCGYLKLILQARCEDVECLATTCAKSSEGKLVYLLVAVVVLSLGKG